MHPLCGLLYVSGKLPTYPSPKPTLTLTSHLRQNGGLAEGLVGRSPETYSGTPPYGQLGNKDTSLLQHLFLAARQNGHTFSYKKKNPR